MNVFVIKFNDLFSIYAMYLKYYGYASKISQNDLSMLDFQILKMINVIYMIKC